MISFSRAWYSAMRSFSSTMARGRGHPVDGLGVFIVEAPAGHIVHGAEEGVDKVVGIVEVRGPVVLIGHDLAGGPLVQEAALVDLRDLHGNADLAPLGRNDLQKILGGLSHIGGIAQLQIKAVLVAGLLQKALGLLHIVGDLGKLRVVADQAVGEDAVFQLALTGVQGVQHSLTVQAHLQCLANVHISQGLLILVQADVMDTHPGTGDDLVRIAVGLVHEIVHLGSGVVQIQQIQLAVFKHHPLGGLVGNVLHGDARALGGAAPAVLVGHQNHLGVELPALKDKGAGTDGHGGIDAELVAGLLGGLLVQNGGAGVVRHARNAA